MNRTERRKMARNKTIRTNIGKGAALGLATMLLAGVSTQGAMAAYTPDETPTIEKDSIGKDYFNASHDEHDAIALTQSEKDVLDKQWVLSEGQMTGTVKLSMSQADKDSLKALGIDIDLAASEAATNKSTKSTEYPRLELSVKKDTDVGKKLDAAAKSHNVDRDGGLKFNFLRKDLMSYASTLPNIATAKTVEPAIVEAGQVIDGFQATAVDVMDTNDDRYNADSKSYTVATLNPVSSVIGGGIVLNGDKVSQDAYTIITDNYSDGDSAERLSKIARSGNGHGANISNCIVDKCSVWITPTIDVLDADDNPATIAIGKTFKIDVETTITAGKYSELLDTNKPLVTSTGAKLWFEMIDSKAYASPDNMAYAPAKLGAWEHTDYFKERSASLVSNKVALQDVTTDAAGRVKFDLSSSTNSFKFSGMTAAGNQGVLTLERTGVTPLILTDDNGKELTVGSKLNFDEYDLKVTAITDKSITFGITKVDGDFPDGGMQAVYMNMGIGLSMLITNGARGDFYGNVLKFTPATEKPVEPVRPTPLAKDDSKSGKFGQPVTIDILANDTINTKEGYSLVKDSVSFLTDAGRPAKSITIPSQGTYKVNADSTVTFTPEKGFHGKADAVKYFWSESKGDDFIDAHAKVQAIITPEDVPVKPQEPKPVAELDVAKGEFGQTLKINIMKNDTVSKGYALVKGSIELQDPVSKKIVKSVSVAKQGTYTVNDADSTVTFKPVSGFSGTATALKYEWTETKAADNSNPQKAGSTVQAIIAPVDTPDEEIIVETPKPTAVKDVGKGKHGEQVTIAILSNDKASKGYTINVDSIQLQDPATKAYGTKVSIAKQGSYEVKGENVVFTPVDKFSGEATAVNYIWEETLDTDTSKTQSTGSTVQAIIAPAEKKEKEEIPEKSTVTEKKDKEKTPEKSTIKKEVKKEQEKKEQEKDDSNQSGEECEGSCEAITLGGGNVTSIAAPVAAGIAGIFAGIGCMLVALRLLLTPRSRKQ